MLQASDARWKVVVGHHPVFSTGEHGSTSELMKHILPVLEVRERRRVCWISQEANG